jgi:hypothetical protein
MSATTTTGPETEVAILARVLANGDGPIPRELAHYIANLDFSDRDKARMNDLAARNQDGTLSSPEKDELFGYARAGTILAILQSKARRSLKSEPDTSSRS